MSASSAYRRRREALLALLRALPGSSAAAQATIEGVATAAAPGGWAPLVEEAAVHGVLGVIAPHLARSALPRAVMQTIERRRTIEAMWRQLVVATLEEAASAIAAAGVPVCALKGPALAARLYDPPGARASLDVDLLVRPDDLDRAALAMREAGYEGDADVQASYLRRHSHHLHFVKPRRAAVELHFHAYAGFGIVLPASALLDRATPFQLSPATTVLAPAPEDELLYLAVHAAGHSFIRLIWLYDLKLLIERSGAIDWDAVFRRAERTQVSNAVHYALGILHRWLGVPLPAGAAARRRSIRSSVATLLLEEVSRPSEPGARDMIGGLVFTSLLCDRTASTAWLLQHHTWRVARRRLHRLAPRALPPAWAG